MTSFTFLVPDDHAARFDRVAEGQGGRSALLRRLIAAVIDPQGEAPMPIIAARGAKADQRLEVLLTSEEVAAIEARAEVLGMKRSAWLTSLVRRHLHKAPEPPASEARALEGIRSELRRIGVNINQIAQAAHGGGAGEGAVRQLADLQEDIRRSIAAVGAARRGDLAYWDVAE